MDLSTRHEYRLISRWVVPNRARVAMDNKYDD